MIKVLLNKPRQAIHRFFANRAPRSDDISFGLKNVYVFFSRQGVLFGLLLVVTFMTGVNYSNNLVLGLCFYLFGIWLVGVFYTFMQISSLKVRLVETTLAPVGELVWATLEISNKSGKPSRQVVLEFEQDQTQDFDPEFAKHCTATIISVDKTTLVRLPIMTHQRGKMTLPRLCVHSVYPFGVMKAWGYAYFQSHAWVYPKPVSFEWQNTKHAIASDGEQFSTAHMVGQNDFDMLNDYIEGESLARVSWVHVARGAGMLTKHFADPMGQEWLIDYDDMPNAHHEGRLSELAFAIGQMQHAQLPFLLKLPSGMGQLGQGEHFIQQSLLRLAQEP